MHLYFPAILYPEEREGVWDRGSPHTYSYQVKQDQKVSWLGVDNTMDPVFPISVLDILIYPQLV